MTYQYLAHLHLLLILPLVPVGAWLLVAGKGTAAHVALGRFYMLAVFLSSSVSLFMPAQVGARYLGHFGWLHILAIAVLLLIPLAWRSARQRNIHRHKSIMKGIYFGGIILPGIAAVLQPGRILHEFLF